LSRLIQSGSNIFSYFKHEFLVINSNFNQNYSGKCWFQRPFTIQLQSFMSSVIDHQESSFMMKRSMFVQSSSSQVTSSSTISTGTGTTEPNVEVHSYTSQSQEKYEKIGDKPPVQFQSQKTQEYHQQNQEKPVIHQESITKVMNGVSESKELIKSTSSTPIASPKPTRKSTAPRFITPLNGKIVDQGADVVLDCIVDGFPQPSVSWYKNGQDLVPKEGSVIVTWELNHAKLELHNVNVKDAGRYTCKAINSVGTASSTADIVVKKTIFPPVFGRRLQAQVAKVGERVCMGCEVTGTPDPVITWYKDGIQILGAVPGGPFRTKIQGNSYSLIIEKAGLEHSGKYTVKAVNSGGEAQCIADFIVMEPQPEYIEPELHMMTHVVFKDVKEEMVQQREHQHKTTSSKITTEQIELQPPQPEIIKPSTTETGTSPISISPQKLSPSIGKPITTESVTVTESTKTEKHMSIKMERTPSPAFHKPPEETPAPKEKIKNLKRKKKESEPPAEELNIEKEEPENTGIETGSISKKSALDFFVSKLNEKEEDFIKEKPKEKEIIPLKTSVKENVFQFEELKQKEDDKLPQKETEPKEIPVLHDKSEVITHFEIPSRESPSIFSKKEEFSSFSKSEIHRASPVPEKPNWDQIKYNTFPFQSSTTSQFHTEQHMKEFNLQPEPPPEIGYIPKTEVPTKLRLDMPSRVKKLEESHRVLSPVEIPSGAVKIFPTPSPTVEKPELKPKPETPKPEIPKPEVPKPTVETEIKTQAVEETVRKEVQHIPSKPAFDDIPLLEEHAPVTPKPWSPRPLTPLDSSQTFSTSSFTKTSMEETVDIRRAASPRPSAEGVAMEKLWTPHKPAEPEPIITRPVSRGTFEKAMSPKPSMEGLAMDKIWAHKHPDSALKKSWPPPQVVEEKKPVIPWAAKGSIEKTWPPCESGTSVMKESETKLVKEFPSQKTTIVDFKEEKELSCSTSYVKPISVPEPPKPVQHYVSETRVIQSPATVQTQFHSMSTKMEHVEMKSDHEERSEIFRTSQEILPKEPSPPVVEEKILRPSEAKKIWPPGPKEEFEMKAPPILKDTPPRRDSFPKPVPVPEPFLDTFLEPGPPPEIAFAPPPPVERRQSLVESIEQEIQKDLEKEPSRHLVGAVRTIPPPPQKEKTIKVPEVKPVPTPKKETKKPIIKEKPFEKFPDLEPFPFRPDEPKDRPAKLPPPPKPSKFTKGEFASSDYESDFESVHIPAKWRPYESDTEEMLSYRRVIPPTLKQPRRPKSTEPEPLPPSKFDQPPQFTGPPRPSIDKVQSEKVKKHHHHHHSSESKKKHSPPALKPGSPPIFVQPTVVQQEPISDQKKTESVSPPKSKPDSPKSKPKPARNEFAESGYMADTDEPPRLRQSQMSHKYSHFKHEEMSKTTIEQTTFSQQSSQIVQQQEQHKIEKPVPVKPQPTPKIHHKHSDHKSEKKVMVSATSTKAKKEVPTSTTAVTHTVTQVQREEKLEPFPFKVEFTQSAPKRVVGPPPPSPSKFIKGDFRESDYESDYDGRIPVKWRPCDSDADEPSYKPVRPILTPGGSRIQSRASEGRTPTPPTEFDNPPQFGGPPRPKFQPIEKPVKLDDVLKTPEKPQKVFKPTPVTPKRHSPIEMIVATPAVKEPEIILKPGSPPELGYVPPPTKSSPFPNATQMETSKVMKFAESTEHSHRVVSVQQTTRVIKFGDKEKEPVAEPKLEPFPFKPGQERPRRKSGPPPTTPKKFIPGEFRESDYESDVENPSMQAPSPMEFDTKPKRLKRVEEMRRRFSDTTTSSIQKKTIATKKPPEFGFVPAATSYVASKHMNEMTNTFKSKAQQFVDDIITDVKTVRENGHVDMSKAPPSGTDENDPQAYREESRIAEYGTKHIDPDTGLIYFKYDFGYEFGIVLPGEGKKQGEGDKKQKRPRIEKKRDDDIEVPVIHEKSDSENKKMASSGKIPQFKPKKFVHAKGVKWEPSVSESEMSEAEGDSNLQHKKRYNLPQPTTGMFQKAPHILIPPSRWEQASNSPVSLSPSLPSLSPRYVGHGPQSVTPGVDSTGRGSTPTPPSTPSTPGSTHGSVGNLTQPRKPPTFITPLRDIAVVSGQTARFECIVQAEPPPNILWSKNGRIIENSHNYQIHYRNGVCRLTIPQAYPEDGGSYTCTATNMLGTIGTTGTLQVPGERRSIFTP
ncbi:hypothetical protein L9F63_012602, partial [Diploptera punctata]